MSAFLGAAVQASASLISTVVQTATPIPGGRTVLLADITAASGSGLKGVALGICGTIFTIILVVKVLSAWAEEKYGKMVTLVVAGAVVALFIFFPDTGLSILKSIAEKLGSGA